MIAAGIEYDETGDGPPIICLHGIGGHKESFRHQLEGLTDYRVIAWNMPGYGASPARPLSFSALSEALFDFIETLGFETAHLLGHSIGGMLAIEHALRQPQQVRSLALMGTTSRFGGRDESFKKKFLEARLAPLDAGQTMAEMVALAAPNIVGSDADATSIEAIRTSMTRVPEATWRHVLACLVTFDRHDELTSLALPVCLIAGSEDQNAPAKTMQKMAEKLPDADHYELPGVGHMINQEAPDEVNAILNAFYKRFGR